MKTLSWLAVVAVLVIVASVLRSVLGRDSVIALAIMFVLVIGLVQYLQGGRNWPRVLAAAVGGAAVYALLARLF